MLATVRRGHEQNSSVDDIAVEVSGLKFSHDAPLVDYVRAVVLALFDLISPPPTNLVGDPPSDIKKSLLRLVRKWKLLISKYCKATEDQVRVLQGLESACGSYELKFSSLFGCALQFLYDEDVVS